jgi:hypothetical protein
MGVLSLNIFIYVKLELLEMALYKMTIIIISIIIILFI